MKFPVVALCLASFLFVSFIFPAWGGTAKVPAKLKVRFLFQKNGATPVPGLPNPGNPKQQPANAAGPRGLGRLRAISSRIPGQVFFRGRRASYFVLGGAGTLFVLLSSVAYLLWRKKELDEEEEW